ncbi:DUF4231 domain-containing protein [Nocardiopsis chromatogenes]|uniref:DUF4231 domain-containing protein n=1 Tax=Nocardiopsis chromatogenes TaxID=280239 RepID=UPI00034BD4F2|nr:DUF4231 domain-containing protein [Nocardiopsis chromatogenes]
MNRPADGVPGDVPTAVLRLRDEYRRRADRALLLFRLSGTALILLGAAMPLFAIADYPYKAAAVSVAGVAMSLSASLHAFFRWDRQWRLLRGAQLDLEDAHLEWSLAAVDPGTAGPERDARIAEADRSLFERYRAIRGAETEKFFSLVEFPGRPEEKVGPPE